MLSRLSHTQKGILYALLGYSAFVVSDACAKYLTVHYPVLQIVGWSYIFSLLCGLLFSPFLGGVRRTLQTKKLPLHLGRSFFNCGLAVSIVIAFQHLPMISVYPVLFLAPFLITILAIPLYKERVQPILWVLIAIGFSGVVIAFQPWNGDVNPWIMAAFVSLMCICGLGLLARQLGMGETLLSLSFYPNIINSILFFPLVFFIFPLPELAHLPYFILGGVMLTCGITCVASSYVHAQYSVVAPLHYCQIPLVFMVGYFAFGEVPDLFKIIGSALIVGSGLMLIFLKYRSTD